MDSDQLRAAKTGDSGALDIVFQWFTDELFGFFRPRVSWDTAADLVQQTSVEVLEKFAEAPGA